MFGKNGLVYAVLASVLWAIVNPVIKTGLSYEMTPMNFAGLATDSDKPPHRGRSSDRRHRSPSRTRRSQSSCLTNWPVSRLCCVGLSFFGDTTSTNKPALSALLVSCAYNAAGACRPMDLPNRPFWNAL